jgi:uncharacterized protein (DUF2141 family)
LGFAHRFVASARERIAQLAPFFSHSSQTQPAQRRSPARCSLDKPKGSTEMKFAKLAVVCMATLMAPVYAADLTVEIKGLTSANGKVLISLFDKADGWMKRGLKTSGVDAQKDGVTYEFKDLPMGEYALSIHHDENGNGKFDTNLVGMPIEPYGFSNDAMGNFGPPTFEQAKFKLDQDKKTITLNLK